VHPAHDVEHTAMGASVVTSAGYSNADKHRAIRVASGRTMPHRTNQIPGRYDITMHPVEPGFVIAEGLDDRLGEVDATTAVHVQRPGQVWVAPGAELMQIHDYVSEVVIPTLRTGGVASPNLPRQVRLGDTGDTDEQRIEAGGDIPAHIRCGREALAPAREVMAGAVQVLPPPEGRHQACLGHGGGHTTWTCRTCDQTVYGPPLNKHCTAPEGPAAVWISTAR